MSFREGFLFCGCFIFGCSHVLSLLKLRFEVGIDVSFAWKNDEEPLDRAVHSVEGEFEIDLVIGFLFDIGCIEAEDVFVGGFSDLVGFHGISGVDVGASVRDGDEELVRLGVVDEVLDGEGSALFF